MIFRFPWALLVGRALVFSVSLLIAGCDSDDRAVVKYRVAKQMMPENSPGDESSPPADGYQWEVPESWAVLPGSGIRLAAFQVEENQADAVCTVVQLGLRAADPVANVNRWRSQLGLAPISEEEVAAQSIREKGRSGEFVYFRLISDTQTPGGILAAILPFPDTILFVKLGASAEVLDDHRDEFVTFCRSIQRK